MKIKILGYLVALTIAVVAAFNVNIVPNKKFSNISLANIEAIASGEGGAVTIDCWSTVSDIGPNAQTHVTYCGDCTAVLARGWSNKSTCTK